MEDSKTSHIDKVIDTIKSIGRFDLNCEIFKIFLITKFFAKYGISEENLKALFMLLDSVSDKKYQINTDNNDEQYIEITNVSEDEQLRDNKKDLPEIDKSDLTFFEQQGAIIKQIVNIEKLSRKECDYSTIYQKFLDEINKSEGNQKQYVIEYLYTKFIEDAIKDIEKSFWENYILSLIKAEYIIIDDYSQKLIDTIIELEKFYSDLAQIIDIKSFYIVKSFVRISWYVIDYCYRDKKMIENKGEFKEILIINTDRKMRFWGNQNFNRIDFTIGEKQSRLYERLMESIIEMTGIDYHYAVSNENVEKLIQLLGRISKFDLNDKIIEIIKIKTCVLFYGIHRKILLNNDCVINIDTHIIKECASYYKQFYDQCVYNINDSEDEHLSKNPFVRLRNEYKNRSIDYELFNEYKYETYLHDVEIYDKYSLKGIEDYCNNSEYLVKYKDNTLVIADIEKFIHDKTIISSQHLIVNFIICSLNEIERDINEGNIDIDEKLKTLNRLERMLAQYIIIHKTNKIPSFRPTFLYSFYQITKNGNDIKISFQEIDSEKITNYDCSKISDYTFFFSSVDLSPIRMVWLEKQLSEYKTKIQQLNFRYDHLLNSKAEGKIQEFTAIQTNIGEKITEVADKQEQIKKEEERMSKELDSTRTNNMTVLGIFAGMLMFATSSAQFFKLESATFFDYLKFAFIFVGSLSFFSVTIKLLFDSNCDQETIKKWVNGIWKSFITIVLVILVIIILFSFFLYFYNGYIKQVFV